MTRLVAGACRARALAQGCAAWLVFSALGQAQAQEWTGPPVSEVFSKDRSRFVRIVPAAAATEAGPYATAEFYRRDEDRSYRLVVQTALVKAVAPVDFVVSDTGYLAVLDNWHSMGQGVVIAFYDPQGKPIRAYEVADLFAPHEVAALPRRVSSSLRWRQGATYVRPDQATLQVSVNSSAYLVFGMETGRFQYCERQEGQPAVQCREGAGQQPLQAQERLAITR
jgi:hypothetical protein